MSEPEPAHPPAEPLAEMAPARRALADRQATARGEAGKPARNKASHPVGTDAKLPRAGTFSNARLPRANSATAGLPRGRSFQGVRPLSAAAQAAQDGYHQRKAQKMYAERRRAAAAARLAALQDGAEKGGDGGDGVINITVDDKGVKIDSARGAGQGNQGMGGRKGSRSRMTRSSSRQRNQSRAEDKENVTNESGQKASDADIEEYFNRKRGSVDPRRKRDSFSEHAGSTWDGSMPKRQNSRSFIDRNQNLQGKTKANADNAANAESDKSKSAVDYTAKSNHGEETAVERPRRQRSQKNPKKNAGKRHEDRPNRSPKEEEEHVTAVAVPAKKTEEAEVLSTPAKDSRPDNCNETKRSNSPTISNISESGTEGDSKSSSPEQSKKEASLGNVDHEHTESLGSSPSVSKDSLSKTLDKGAAFESTKIPLNGKWCGDCAGLGLHITALLAELGKHRASVEIGAEPPSSSSGTKKGWKTIVLGDSKSKSSSEKARLQQEVNVLRATVDFLYKKIESMEAVGAPALITK